MEKTNKLESLYLYVTSYCNLHCGHCWVTPKTSASGARPKDAPISIFKEAIKQALPLGLKMIKISGGEPLIRNDILELLEYTSNLRLFTHLETNGICVDKTMADTLKRLKIGNVSISLDADTPGLHDTLRGKTGAFEKTILAIKMLKERGLPVEIVMSVYAANAKNIPGAVSRAADLGVNCFKINCLAPIGRGKMIHKKGQALSVPDWLKLNKKVRGLQKKFPFPVYLDIPMAFKTLDEIRYNVNPCCIESVIGVLPDGNLSVCGIGTHFKSLRFGSIGETSIREVWNNSRFLAYIRKSIPHKLKGVCGNCIYKSYCMGKCRADAYCQTGDILAPYPFCEEAEKLGLFPSDAYIKRKAFK